MAEKIVLALGGGGVKGIAHLGVVACLLDNGYEIEGIAGTSAGGMFGAPLAAKVAPHTIFNHVVDFFKNPDLKREKTDGPSLAGTHGLETALAPFIQDKLIEDLPIKFVATAVSLKTGKEVLLDTGELMHAVLATIAIPGVFPPIGEEELVDGGVLDPVPVLQARALNPSLPIVAVVLNTKDPNAPQVDQSLGESDPLTDLIVDRLSKTVFGESLDIASRGIGLIGHQLAEVSLENSKPDVIVRPLVGQHGPLSNVNPQELYDEGYRAMKSQLKALEEANSLFNSLIRIAKYSTAHKTDNKK